MAKPNYRHAKRQKEAARMARKQEKLLRKRARGDTSSPAEGAEPAPIPVSDT
jgi:hypothetical protein